MNNEIKRHVSSFIQTFIAMFLTTVGTAILALPQDQLLDPKLWTATFIGSILVSAVRSAIKAGWEATLE